MRLSFVPLERPPRRTGGEPCLGAPKVKGSLRGEAEACQGLLSGALGRVRSGLIPREPRGQVGRRPGPRPPRPRPHGVPSELSSRSHESGLLFISRQRRPTASRRNLKKRQRKYATPSSSWPPRSDAPAAVPGPRRTASLPRLGPRCRRLLWAPGRASAEEGVRSLNQNT